MARTYASAKFRSLWLIAVDHWPPCRRGVSGYGNLVPTSPAARIVCCLYSIVGIPLCLVALVAVGDRLTATTCWVERRIRCDSATDAAGGRRCERFVGVGRTVMVACVGFLIFILLPSVVFSFYQEWDYATAVYFSVVSLSTIGFGDYVAGR